MSTSVFLALVHDEGSILMIRHLVISPALSTFAAAIQFQYHPLRGIQVIATIFTLRSSQV